MGDLFLIDDLFSIVLDNIADYANRQHLESLKDHLRRVTFMYERGLLGKEAFEEQRAKALKAIEAHSLHLERRRSPGRSLELRL